MDICNRHLATFIFLFLTKSINCQIYVKASMVFQVHNQAVELCTLVTLTVTSASNLNHWHGPRSQQFWSVCCFSFLNHDAIQARDMPSLRE